MEAHGERIDANARDGLPLRRERNLILRVQRTDVRLHVIVGVQVPKKPSRELRDALEALRTVLPADTGDAASRDQSTDDKPFFERVKDIFG